MAQIYLPSTGPEAWKFSLADPDRHWRRGFSARATAHSWEAAKGLPSDIAALLPPQAVLQLALVEHQVALPGGGRSSQCDVFALVRAGDQDIALAVEAKVNEPFGPTLGEWMQDASPGKVQRLTAICALLGLREVPKTLRYQLLHRTAAAVLEAQRFHRPVAAMIVQSFSPDHRWSQDFAAFTSALGMAPLAPGQSGRMTLPGGTDLILGWATGAPAFLEA